MLLDALRQLSLSWLLLGAITALSLYWLWTKTRRPYMKYNIPPFPVPPLPVFGHFFMLGFNFMEKFKEWHNKVGDIFSIDIGGQLNIVVSDYDIIKEVLIKSADSVTNTPHMFTSELLNEKDKGIVGARDENWKEQRTTSLAILRDFGMGKNLLAQQIQEEVSVFIEKLADLKGRPDDIRMLANVSVSNVICAIIVGKRFEHDDPYFVRFIEEMNDLLKYLNRAPLVTAFPILYYLPGDLFSVKKMMSCGSDINEMFSKSYIRKFKQTFSKNEEPANFIVAYLQEMGKKKDQGKATQLSEENLITIIRTLFVAGTETTSTTILWCILYTLYYPEVQEKVYAEIKEHVGPERSPNMSDKPKLKYLNAVIMETQRMACIAPTGLRREISNQLEIGGYTFPIGSVFWPNIERVLHSKKVWGDPEKFRPERFLDKTGSLLNPDELIPFSMGRRVCLGKGLALMELYLFLSSMFQTFKFEPADKSGPLPSMKPVVGGTLVPEPFQVRFISRKGYD